jgi:aerobic carbon-monoxide dehydrogenase medium subunit
VIPAGFGYHRATSVEQALGLMAEHAGAKVLAGGHSLIPMMKLRLAQPESVIDIGRIAELQGIEEQGDTIVIRALTTHHEVSRSKVCEKRCPVLVETAEEIGDPQVRHLATVGGNVAHADPASDWPATFVALGAHMVLRSAQGERRVEAKDFFLDLLMTDLRRGEILTAVEVPVPGKNTGTAYLKREHPASGYAMCGAAAVVTMDGGSCTRARLALNGVAAAVVHAEAVGQALVGTDASDEAIARAVEEHLTVEDPLADVQASADYRMQLARVYSRRALAKARDRA